MERSVKYAFRLSPFPRIFGYGLNLHGNAFLASISRQPDKRYRKKINAVRNAGNANFRNLQRRKWIWVDCTSLAVAVLCLAVPRSLPRVLKCWAVTGDIKNGKCAAYNLQDFYRDG